MTTESISVKVLYDAVGTDISVELENGEMLSGTLSELQTNMNLLLTDVTRTNQAGTQEQLKSVYVRGSNVVFIQLPDALKTSPALLAAGAAVPSALDKRGEGKGFGSARRANVKK